MKCKVNTNTVDLVECSVNQACKHHLTYLCENVLQSIYLHSFSLFFHSMVNEAEIGHLTNMFKSQNKLL